MWEQIGAAAIYGAIGGGVGGLVGALLATPFRNTRFGSLATTILAVVCVVLGVNFAEPVLSPYIGKYLPKSDAEVEFDKQFDAALSELTQFPTFAAILEREPKLEDQLKNDLVAALENVSTPAAANVASFSASYTLIQSRYLYYVVRATDEDLTTFFATNVEVTADLLQRDPEFCYNINYNPSALTALGSIGQLRKKFAPGLFDRQQEEGAALVKNAHDAIPEYDHAIAQTELESASAALISVLGQENLGLISGQRFATSEEEAALACEASLALLNSVLASEHTATIGRHIFAGIQ